MQNQVVSNALTRPEARTVIVYVEGLPTPATLKPTPASIVQKDEQFVPHVVAVSAGSEVAFPNEDPFFHNVFSLSRPATFDLGRFPPGSSRGTNASANAAIASPFARAPRRP